MCSPVLLSLPCCVSFVMGPVRVAPFSSARLLQACHATGVPPCVAEAQPRFCAHVATAPVLPRPQRAPAPPTVPVPPPPRPALDAPSHTAPGEGGALRGSALGLVLQAGSGLTDAGRAGPKPVSPGPRPA